MQATISLILIGNALISTDIGLLMPELTQFNCEISWFWQNQSNTNEQQGERSRQRCAVGCGKRISNSLG